MSIGDINSTEKGSGARYNDGKVPLDLLPLRLLARGAKQPRVQVLMAYLADIQERRGSALEAVFVHMTAEDVEAVARVFEYGRQKYAAWNWTKGMAWSIPLACAARHLMAIERGEVNDPDSGKPHVGHYWCNVIMLNTFASTYIEGDDLPPAGSLA